MSKGKSTTPNPTRLMKMKHTEFKLSVGDSMDAGDLTLRSENGFIVAHVNQFAASHGDNADKAIAARLALAWNCHQEFKEALEQTLLAMLDHAGWVKNFAPDGKELPMSRPSRVQKAEALARAILAKATSAE